MTQSGQGEESSPRPAREGIVLPSDGGAPLLPGMTGDRTTPAGGQAWDRPWGPDQQGVPGPQPVPQQEQGWGPPVNGTQTWGAAQPDQSGAPAPASDWGTPGAPQGWASPEPQQPQPQLYAQPQSYAQPLPPVIDESATQLIPPIPAAPGGVEGATQFIPPVPSTPGGGEAATQYIPPVGPGALPPEVHVDATQFLGRQSQPGAGPLPPAVHPDAQATQYIAPVPAQSDPPYGNGNGSGNGSGNGIRPGGGSENRQPPAEFDNLFRSEPEAPPATQYLPRIDASTPHAAQAPGAYAAQAPGAYGAQAAGAYGAQDQGVYGAPAPGGPGAPGGRAANRRGGANDGGGGRGGRSGSRVPLIVAIGVGIAVIGIGAGALLRSGGGEDSQDDNAIVSATAPATDDSATTSADPAKAQAVELDKLLADANASRDSVINAVADVTACKNLGQAAADLRAAADQRGKLITRLDALALDKLPNNAELTTALQDGWKASESADNHYAAWADQAAGKKGCKGGRAVNTGESQAANQDSGTASTAKEEAAKLWNSIASTYDLTQRSRTQL